MATLLQRQFANRAYWEKREREAREAYMRTEAEELAEIQRIYRNMGQWADDEINRFYGKYAGVEGIDMAEAIKRVTQADIEAYQELAKKYVAEAQAYRELHGKTKQLSDQANAVLRLYNSTMRINRLELLKARIGVNMIAGIDQIDVYCGDKMTDRADAEYRRLAGILGRTVTDKDIDENAKAIVNASFKNATYSQRIWSHQDRLRSMIDIELQKGLIAGIGSRQMAANIRKEYNVSQSDAERLMVTELRRVQTEVAMNSYKAQGITQYEYMAVNPNACPICRAINGKIYNVREGQIGENLPPMHPRCHCTTAPWQDPSEYEAWLNWLESGGTTADREALDPQERARLIAGEPVSEPKQSATEYKEIDIDEFKKLKGEITKDERAIIYGSTRLDGYINSSNARVNINAPLRAGEQPQGKYKTIADTLQAVIDKNTLQENLKLTRYVGTDALEGMFGIPPVKVGLSDTIESSYKKMTDALEQRTKNTYTEKGFLSTSAVESNNVMTDKSVKINIYAEKGTPAYVSTNYKESEVIFGQGTTLELIDITLNTNVAPWQYEANCRLKK